MQHKPNTKLRDFLITFRLGKNFTKVVRSNGKNMNHSLMEHLMVCYCLELDTNWEAKQLFKKMVKAHLCVMAVHLLVILKRRMRKCGKHT